MGETRSDHVDIIAVVSVAAFLMNVILKRRVWCNIIIIYSIDVHNCTLI